MKILPIYHKCIENNQNVIIRWINDILNENISITNVVCRIWPDMWFSSLWDLWDWGTESMMTSANWDIFRVNGPLCGEFTGPQVNYREADGWRRHRGHYDVIVMSKFLFLTINCETTINITAWKLLLDSVDMIVHEIDTLSESYMLQGC